MENTSAVQKNIIKELLESKRIQIKETPVEKFVELFEKYADKVTRQKFNTSTGIYGRKVDTETNAVRNKKALEEEASRLIGESSDDSDEDEKFIEAKTVKIESTQPKKEKQEIDEGRFFWQQPQGIYPSLQNQETKIKIKIKPYEEYVTAGGLPNRWFDLVEKQFACVPGLSKNQKLLALRQNTGEIWDEKIIGCRTFEEAKRIILSFPTRTKTILRQIDEAYKSTNQLLRLSLVDDTYGQISR